jgi:hypothetical protein
VRVKKSAGAWSVVKMSPTGEHQLAAHLSWEAALSLADEALPACQPGETISLREGWLASGDLAELFRNVT